MKMKLTDDFLAEKSKNLPEDILKTAADYQGSRNGNDPVKGVPDGKAYTRTSGSSGFMKAASIVLVAAIGMVAVITGITVSRSKKGAPADPPKSTDSPGPVAVATDRKEPETTRFPFEGWIQVKDWKLDRIEPYGTVPPEFQDIIKNNYFGSNVKAFSDRLIKTEQTLKAGENDKMTARIIMTDLYGAPLAQREVILEDYCSIKTAIVTSDGGFLYAIGYGGYYAPQTGNDFSSHVIKCDSSGNVQFDTELDGIRGSALYYCIEDGDRYYFFGTNREYVYEMRDLRDVHIAVLNASGELIKTRTIGGSKEDYLSSAGISPDGFFELSTRSESFDGDYSGIGIYNSMLDDIIFSVDRDLNIVKKKVQDYWRNPADKTRIGEKDGSAVLRSDPLFEGFDAGTPDVYIDYGDFYLIVSNHRTGPFPYQPLEISSIWYCYETVYSAYDTNGTLLFRSAVDDFPYSEYFPEFFSSGQ
jgi:hypothetical protein